MKDLKQIVQDTQQQVKSNPQSMNNSVQGTTPTPVPSVQSTPQRQSQMESVPRVDPTVLFLRVTFVWPHSPTKSDRGANKCERPFHRSR